VHIGLEMIIDFPMADSIVSNISGLCPSLIFDSPSSGLVGNSG